MTGDVRIAFATGSASYDRLPGNYHLINSLRAEMQDCSP